jgi:hypothetical protein
MPISVCFNFLDCVTPLTPEMAKTLLEEAYACGCKTVTNYKARAILFNINRIQFNLIEKTLDGVERWCLFKLDPNFSPFEEKFPGCKAGFTVMLSVAYLKKKLFTKLYPDVEYGVSIMDKIIDQIK